MGIGLKKSNIHVVFTLKNSRYDFQKGKRKKPFGFIGATFPFFDGEEEEILIEELCDVALELNLKLICLNFCGDHVHCLICTEVEFLPKIMLLWKGKTAYNFNKRFLSKETEYSPNSAGNSTQGLWAKSYYQKVVKNENELSSTVNYIIKNRIKHGLKPLSSVSSEKIAKTVSFIQ